MKKTVYVFGHKNPDTDAVVSAISYAYLKNALAKKSDDEKTYIAARCGHLNAQTAHILKKFDVPAPTYISDLAPKVEYYMSENLKTIRADKSIWDALEHYELATRRAIPVVDKSGHYKALLHYSVIAQNFVEILSSRSSLTSQSFIDEKLLKSISVESMADESIAPVRKTDSLGKVRKTLSASPIRRLPVVDENGIVMALISEHDLTNEANIEVILVDHNEVLQAVDGVENYRILEVIDHHKIAPLPSSSPILFLNRPIGSTSTIVTTLFQDASIPLPPKLASILLSGILSDTLILQSGTTTDTDKAVAAYLSKIANLDIDATGHEILEAGSHIAHLDAKSLINGDMKLYNEHGAVYTVSQIEVANLGEVLDRKDELLLALGEKRTSSNAILCALLVTDITQLSSILLVKVAPPLAPFITLPELEESIYYLKDVVSRKKQLIPLITEILTEYKNAAA